MKVSILVLVLSLTLVLAQNQALWRSIDGKGNNVLNPTWGSTGIKLLRKGPAVYANMCGSLRNSVNGDPLPSGRAISNIVHKAPAGGQPLNKRGLTDFVTYWGQFLDHDVGLTGGPRGSAVPLEPLAISVPVGDKYYNASMIINRSVFDPTTGCAVAANNPRQQVNLITSFIDGSQVYGSDNDTYYTLRAWTGGLLKSNMVNGEEMPPMNTNGINNANDAHVVNDTLLYLFGDVRGNENPALTSLHIVFLREHNRRAKELATKFPAYNDEALFQEARRWVIALLQQITFQEYLPVTVGDAAPDYNGYNSTVNPSMYTEFSSGAFRYGHSEVADTIWRVDANNTVIPQGHLALKDSYFNSPSTLSLGPTPILRGMAAFKQNAVDNYFVDALRNFLFGAPGAGGFDLTAINIERARDHGVPAFNDFRAAYGLPRYVNWSEIHPDPVVWMPLAQAYTTLNDCDVYTCGLAEDQERTANVGPTFLTSILEQYTIIRDGDRFWYEAPGQWTAAELDEIHATTLADVIVRNTAIKKEEIQCFVMATADSCGRPIPATTKKYDVLVTLRKKTAAHPYFGKGHPYGYVVDGVEGGNMTLQRGKTYTIYIQASCQHSFKVVEGEVPDSDLYAGIDNQFTCIEQDAFITLTIDDATINPLWYHCDFHDWMGGRINILDGPAKTSAPTKPTDNDGNTLRVAFAFVLALITLFF